MDLFVTLSYVGCFATVAFCCIYTIYKWRQPDQGEKE